MLKLNLVLNLVLNIKYTLGEDVYFTCNKTPKGILLSYIKTFLQEIHHITRSAIASRFYLKLAIPATSYLTDDARIVLSTGI